RRDRKARGRSPCVRDGSSRNAVRLAVAPVRAGATRLCRRNASISQGVQFATAGSLRTLVACILGVANGKCCDCQPRYRRIRPLGGKGARALLFLLLKEPTGMSSFDSWRL